MRCDDAILILENADRICNEQVIAAETAVEEAFSAVDKLKTAIVIPAGAKNGDVIKALFYVRDVEEMECCTFVSIAGDADMRVYKDWWNATYEAESEESE